MMRYSIFRTLFGWMGVVESEKGLKRIILPHSSRTDVIKNIMREFPGIEENKAELGSLSAQTKLIPLRDKAHFSPCAGVLIKYFEGKPVATHFRLDWSGNAEFSVAVWKVTQGIPRGEVRSYEWISARLKKPGASRAAGSALGKNPFPVIVPCHRVIRKNGALGGFSAPKGILLKQKMLELEGIRFDGKGRVIGFKSK